MFGLKGKGIEKIGVLLWLPWHVGTNQEGAGGAVDLQHDEESRSGNLKNYPGKKSELKMNREEVFLIIDGEKNN